MATPHLSLNTGRRSLDLASRALPASSGLGAGLPPCCWEPSGGGCWFIKVLYADCEPFTEQFSGISGWQAWHTPSVKPLQTVNTEIVYD